MIGAIGGIGQFTADVTLENPNGRDIGWPPMEWPLQLHGAVNGAVVAKPLDLWLREEGTYRFRVRMREVRDLEWTIPFEVAERIGPESPDPQA